MGADAADLQNTLREDYVNVKILAGFKESTEKFMKDETGGKASCSYSCELPAAARVPQVGPL